jgi:hypothetical protein
MMWYHSSNASSRMTLCGNGRNHCVGYNRTFWNARPTNRCSSHSSVLVIQGPLAMRQRSRQQPLMQLEAAQSGQAVPAVTLAAAAGVGVAVAGLRVAAASSMML